MSERVSGYDPCSLCVELAGLIRKKEVVPIRGSDSLFVPRRCNLPSLSKSEVLSNVPSFGCEALLDNERALTGNDKPHLS